MYTFVDVRWFKYGCSSMCRSRSLYLDNGGSHDENVCAHERAQLTCYGYCTPNEEGVYRTTQTAKIIDSDSVVVSNVQVASKAKTRCRLMDSKYLRQKKWLQERRDTVLAMVLFQCCFRMTDRHFTLVGQTTMGRYMKNRVMHSDVLRAM